jgi:hypothetical protein
MLGRELGAALFCLILGDGRSLGRASASPHLWTCLTLGVPRGGAGPGFVWDEVVAHSPSG